MSDDFINRMREELEKNSPTSFGMSQPQEAILEEFSVNGTELHNIATGKCCTINGEMFALRFLLEKSFKSSKSNYVVNQFKIQLIATGKKNVMRKEHIATLTKVVKVQGSKAKEEKEEVKLEVSNNETELF